MCKKEHSVSGIRKKSVLDVRENSLCPLLKRTVGTVCVSVKGSNPVGTVCVSVKGSNPMGMVCDRC